MTQSLQTSPVIRHGSPLVRGLLAALVALVALLVLGAMWAAVSPSNPAAVSLPTSAPAQRTTLPVTAAIGRQVTTPDTALALNRAPISCPYQHLNIVTAEGQTQRACVAATQVMQSGDLRSHLLAPQGLSTWTLRVDTGGGAVRAVSLSADGHGLYRCARSACTGVAIGPLDAHGGRALTLRDVVLVRKPAPGDNGAAATPMRVNLSARLQVPGDQQDPGMACGDTRIAIVERSGAVLTLCPTGGGGMVLAGQGRRIYSLRGEAGDTLEVGVDVQGNVDLVRIGDLQCQGHHCAGAASQGGSEGDREAGRGFSFSGTTLSDGHPGGRTATLNGDAVLPPF